MTHICCTRGRWVKNFPGRKIHHAVFYKWLPHSINIKIEVCSLLVYGLYSRIYNTDTATVYHKKYAHGFVVLCFVVVMLSFILISHEVLIHIHQGCFAGTGAIVRLPQCQWSKPGGYGKISQCITTTKHSKAKTVFRFLGIYCTYKIWAPYASSCCDRNIWYIILHVNSIP